MMAAAFELMKYRRNTGPHPLFPRTSLPVTKGLMGTSARFNGQPERNELSFPLLLMDVKNNTGKIVLMTKNSSGAEPKVAIHVVAISWERVEREGLPYHAITPRLVVLMVLGGPAQGEASSAHPLEADGRVRRPVSFVALVRFVRIGESGSHVGTESFKAGVVEHSHDTVIFGESDAFKIGSLCNMTNYMV